VYFATLVEDDNELAPHLLISFVSRSMLSFVFLCPLLVDNDNESRAHCRQYFFSIPAEDDDELTLVVIFFFVLFLCA